MKRNEGISLVALIITIIVMVILSGIIIVSAFTDGGVIDKAQIALKEKERVTVEEIVIGSYVYKITASTTTIVKLDLEKTAKAIYENLTNNGYKLKEESVIEKIENGTTYKTLKVENEEKIELSIDGKYGTYEGTVEKEGLKNELKTVEKSDDGNEKIEIQGPEDTIETENIPEELEKYFFDLDKETGNYTEGKEIGISLTNVPIQR